MKKLMSAAVASALILAACGGGGGVVATVNGDDITVADVEAVPFSTGGTMDPTQFSQFLGALVQWRIIEDAAADDYGIEPTEDQVTAELDEVLSQLSPGLTIEEVSEQENLSQATLRTFAENGLIQRLVADELAAEMEAPTPQELEALRTAELANLIEVCARHVLVETAEEAAAVKERLDGGEEFAEVAADASIDPSAATNGGDLDCAPAGQYVPEFRDATVEAEIDAITDPVLTQFGFHVIQVYERTESDDAEIPSDEELADQLVQQAGTVSLQAWLAEQVNEAEVTVDEEYGTWALEPQPGIQPPAT